MRLDVEIFDKSHKAKLTDWLTHSEFRCRCDNKDCTFTIVSPRLLNAFRTVRKHWGTPLRVTSGFRCQRHNAEVGGHPDSYHKKGCAIDIVPHKGNIEDLYKLAVKFFDIVIHYKDKGFLHCHMEE